jgi:general secretion pathway protein J
MRLKRHPGCHLYARTGFTLAEVLVSATITAMITLVAVSALKAVADTSRIVEDTTQTTSAVRYAARMLSQDLANFYRDTDPQSMLLTGASQGSDSGQPPSLRFYTTGRLKARTDQPEGDVYEVEYILGETKTTAGRITTDGDTESAPRTLYRRWWPNPDKKRQPGGILSVIGENIDVFQVRFHNGKEWVTEWSADSRELPQLLEVTLAVVPEGGRKAPAVESFVVGFPRMPKAVENSGDGQGPQGQQGQQGQPDQSQPQEGAPSNSGAPPQGNQAR